MTFVVCTRGCRHWGRHGAAGLLIRHATRTGARYLMQERAAGIHHGGTWSIPGGALHRNEQPEGGALREAAEELGTLPALGTPYRIHVADHGGWTYHTITADVASTFEPRNTDGEGITHRWCTSGEIAALRLHPGFAESWQPILIALAVTHSSGLH
ncbi:NUDIX domain-containing protein [Streptomyces sp. R39]|uniref:NUDIX domain-containing protein n=1 Tax=Streptomyces sp. R39 TaxID=3238631 RepID=A0AB39QM06_9ACTN